MKEKTTTKLPTQQNYFCVRAQYRVMGNQGFQRGGWEDGFNLCLVYNQLVLGAQNEMKWIPWMGKTLTWTESTGANKNEGD